MNSAPASSPTVRITSCMAPNSHYIMRAVVDYLRQRTALPVQLVEELPWAERLRQLVAGEIDIGWICGAQYAHYQHLAPHFQLLAAPVWRDGAYGNQPVYYSVIVVRRDSGYQQFADLRGTTWAYNEPSSFSGYLIMLDHLLKLGEGERYFGQQVEAGSHQLALEQIRSHTADVAAIDSTVWEQACQVDPTVVEKLRVIARLGPNPVPPWVVNNNTPLTVQARIRNALLTMADHKDGVQTLAKTPLGRFAAVTPALYWPMQQIGK